MTRSARPSRLRLEPLEDRSVPATFNVTTTLDEVIPGDGKRSLREAVTAANNLAGADVIVLPAGVYKLALSGAGEDANATGDLDITGALTIQGAGKGKTTIDGQQLDRLFDVIGATPSSIRVVFERLTIRNGNVTGHGGGIVYGNADLVVRDSAVSGNRASLTGGGISNGSATGTGDVKVVRTTVARNVADSNGGGLRISGSSVLTVTNSTVRRNIANFGGGINATTANLTNCTVSGNTAGSEGGGIIAGMATLTNSIVSGNFSASFGGGINATTANLTNSTVSGNFAGGSGGGIRATTVTLTNSTVSGNTTGDNGGGLLITTATLINSIVSGNSADSSGGGIHASGGTATLTNSTVSGNSAVIDGGGIHTGTANLTNSTVSGNSTGTDGGGIWAEGTATLTRSTINGNIAGTDGGGISAGTANLTNCTVSGNTALQFGGGIYAGAGSLLNCTITENLAGGGGGVFRLVVDVFECRNTIIALNLAAGNAPDVAGPFSSLGNNLIGNGSGSAGFTDGVNGDIVGTSANPIDPKLGPLANNGGRTKTHALKAGSLAIDRGDNANLLPTDQRGLPRKKDGNGDGIARVDIGAFER